MNSEKKNNALFDLIKSMTPNEKRFFKLMASKGIESTNSVKLFDIIDSLDFYDEKRLIFLASKKIKKGSLIYKKHYLYKLILKSLDEFHNNNTIEDVLRRNLHYVEILFEKTLSSYLLRHNN